MKLGLLTAGFPFGNGERFLIAELRALARECDELVIYPVTPRRMTNADLGGVPAEIVRLPLFSSATWLAGVRDATRRTSHIDHVMAMLLDAPCSSSWRVRNLAVVPVAYAIAADARRRGLDHLHAHWLTAPSTAAAIASIATGIPWSASAHRYDIYAGNLVREKVRRAAFVRVISARGARDLTAQASPIAADRVRVVHLGVDLPDGERTPAPPRQTGFHLLCAAFFERVKGHEFLLRALARARATGIDVTCTLAGDGPQRPHIERRITELGLRDAVRLAGVVPHERILADLHGGVYDASVLPSIEEAFGYMEGIPVSLMEAMAAGVPVIATATGSIPELVDPSCGVLVPGADERALAGAIASLARDPQRRAHLGAFAAERIRDKFDAATNARRLFAMMSAALRRQRAACSAAGLVDEPATIPSSTAAKRSAIASAVGGRQPSLAGGS